ncbi:MAG: hypothetical protein K9K38_02335 [Rhodoferax sp.]|nr:hypothetical protein [Rhodoferax sp.]MCF8208230.1 hypothetical protein [Rhodoferax sp.]
MQRRHLIKASLPHQNTYVLALFLTNKTPWTVETTMRRTRLGFAITTALATAPVVVVRRDTDARRPTAKQAGRYHCGLRRLLLHQVTLTDRPDLHFDPTLLGD